VANGHIFPQVDRYGLNISYRQQNKLYLNTGQEKLINVSGKAGPGLQLIKSSRGAAFADFNNDGAMDIAVVVLDERPLLLMNQGVPGNHWLLVKLVGSKSNRFGVGARVSVTCNGLTQIREMKAGDSYASSNDPRAHFGLGTASVIDQITVRWPSRRVSTFKEVKADQILTVRE